MCDCVDLSELGKPEVAPAWLTQNGAVVHPDAPSGRGVSGHSRAPGPVSAWEDTLLPERGSPAIRGVDPVDVSNANAIALSDVKRQPAPRVAKDSAQTIQGMTVNLIADATGVTGVGDAKTELAESNNGGQVNAHYDEKGICDSLTDGLAWTVDIQTQYGADPEADAAYGRGTTVDDISKGNVTLGFHESCHRQDLLDYLRNKPIPTLNAKVGDKKADVDKAIAAYAKAWPVYFATARSESKTKTDETGDPTLSAYKAGKRKK